MNAVEGTVARGFEAVRDAFAEGQAADRGGAQLCVYRAGSPVVDLWTGHDASTGRAYSADTLTVLMSCTKGAVAFCAHLLAERGALDLDARVAAYWPEFATNGKGEVRVWQLLSHTAGLMGFDPDEPVDVDGLCDWDVCTDALARMAPLWPPGTAYLYHFITYGYLVGELVRRVSGKTPGAFFADEMARPLALDFWIGLPHDEERRLAPHFRSTPPLDAAALERTFFNLGFDADHRTVRAVMAAFTSTEALIDNMNRRRWRAAEIPAGNGVGSARALARLYAGCIGEVDGVGLLHRSTLERARVPLTDELRGPTPFDAITGPSPQRFGCGFELPRDPIPMLGEGSFGHPGAGGRLAFAHPELGVAVGYACNNLVWDGNTPDPRWRWSDALRTVFGV